MTIITSNYLQSIQISLTWTDKKKSLVIPLYSCGPNYWVDKGEDFSNWLFISTKKVPVAAAKKATTIFLLRWVVLHYLWNKLSVISQGFVCLTGIYMYIGELPSHKIWFGCHSNPFIPKLHSPHFFSTFTLTLFHVFCDYIYDENKLENNKKYLTIYISCLIHFHFLRNLQSHNIMQRRTKQFPSLYMCYKKK